MLDRTGREIKVGDRLEYDRGRNAVLRRQTAIVESVSDEMANVVYGGMFSNYVRAIDNPEIILDSPDPIETRLAEIEKMHQCANIARPVREGRDWSHEKACIEFESNAYADIPWLIEQVRMLKGKG